jgi:hypothetical protein
MTNPSSQKRGDCGENDEGGRENKTGGRECVYDDSREGSDKGSGYASAERRRKRNG